MSLTENIRKCALDLGYSKVGVTNAEGFPNYIEELKSKYGMYAWYIESRCQPFVGANPKISMPSAKSIISLV